VTVSPDVGTAHGGWRLHSPAAVVADPAMHDRNPSVRPRATIADGKRNHAEPAGDRMFMVAVPLEEEWDGCRGSGGVAGRLMGSISLFSVIGGPS
jgi:hypothetical protein